LGRTTRRDRVPVQQPSVHCGGILQLRCLAAGRDRRSRAHDCGPAGLRWPHPAALRLATAETDGVGQLNDTQTSGRPLQGGVLLLGYYLRPPP
jgi:hypothetical protein